MKEPAGEFRILRWLDVFLALAEEQHVTRAARRLGVTQSAVSQKLQAMEEELGYPVFRRDRRPLVLTSAGKTLHARAAAIARELRRIQQDRSRILQEVPVLEVGVLSSLASVAAPLLTEIAGRELKAERIGLRTGLATDHLPMIRDHQADLVITSDPLLDIEQLQRIDLLSERFLLVLPRGWKGDATDLARLAPGLPMARFGHGAPAGRLVDQHLRRHRIEIPHRLEFDRIPAVMAVVEAGNAFAILTPTLLLEALQRDAAIDLRPLPATPLSRTITTVYRDPELRPFALKLTGAVRRRLSRVFAEAEPPLPAGSVRFPAPKGDVRTPPPPRVSP
jgi:DNA-binding transcriptional LysR family regulator